MDFAGLSRAAADMSISDNRGGGRGGGRGRGDRQVKHLVQNFTTRWRFPQ